MSYEQPFVVAQVTADWDGPTGTDVTAAIAEYFNGATEVIVPAGQYRIDGALDVPAGKTLH